MAGGGSDSSEEKASTPASTQAPVGNSSPGGGGSKLVAILSVINFVAIAGMLAILSLNFIKEKKSQSIDDIVAKSNEGEGEGSKGKSEGEGEGHGEEHGEGGAKIFKKKNLNFGKMITLEQFTVNLSTPGSVNPKFVRVNISLEVPTEDIEAEVTSKMPQVRNTIIDLFNSKRPSDLATSDGREYLKDEVKNALNSFLINGKVKGVYFTSFALSG